MSSNPEKGLMSPLEAELFYQIRIYGLPEPLREYKTPWGGRHRWDFAFPEHLLLVEVQGGLYMAKGGHNTAKGITRDTKKLNLCAINSWHCMQFTDKQIKDLEAIGWLKQYFQNHCPF